MPLLRLARRERAGFTFVELAIAMVVLLVSLLILSSIVSGMAKQRAVNRETGLAVQAARNQLEMLRSVDFAQVFALYNSDPGDDPDGAGSAPGNHFAVAGLAEGADSPEGLEGEILFPTFLDPVKGLELREDVENRTLGMPRDLSGDNVIDDQDHSGAYFILPVQIRLHWRGPTGARQYEMATQLCGYIKA